MSIKERTIEREGVGETPIAARTIMDDSVDTGQTSPPPGVQFFKHLAEMCVAMCAGGAILSLVFFGGASVVGHSDLDRQYPELGILVGAVTMSVAMAAWMLFRRHPIRHIWEMSGATLVVGILLSSAFWLGVFPESSLVGWFSAHAMLCLPACVAMVLVMLRHLDHYGGKMEHPLATA